MLVYQTTDLLKRCGLQLVTHKGAIDVVVLGCLFFSLHLVRVTVVGYLPDKHFPVTWSGLTALGKAQLTQTPLILQSSSVLCGLWLNIKLVLYTSPCMYAKGILIHTHVYITITINVTRGIVINEGIEDLFVSFSCELQFFL